MYHKHAGAAATRDGITLQYTLHGNNDPARAKLVLVHTLAMNGTIWDEVVEQMSDKATILTYDCRGHGSSTKGAGPFRLEMFADDLADLLDHVGWDSPHVAGASMGGSVALQFAISHPQRVQTLGLFDTTSWYGAEAADRWSWRVQEAQEKGFAGLIAFQQTRWFTDRFREQHADAVARCSNIFLKNDMSSYAAACNMLGAFDLRTALGAVRVPTAIVVGEEDYATPPDMARVLESGIKGSTLLIIPKARHLTIVERPEVIADVLSHLLERVPSAA